MTGSCGIDTLSILGRFKEFCRVDLQLADRTVSGHLYLTKHLLKSIGKPLDQITVDDLRAYLAKFQDRNCNTRANLLKSVKVFFRDFLKRPDLVESFKFPKRSFVPRTVLSRVDLMKFFGALEADRDKLLFLLFASSGLRRSEILNLTIADLDLENRAIIPRNHETGNTKNSWVSFYNQETEPYFRDYLVSRTEANDNRLFPFGEIVVRRAFKKASLKGGVTVTPQVLRFWFANEMSRLGVSDRIIDAFQGRTPRSILARHYSDFSSERLKEAYDKANLTVLT